MSERINPYIAGAPVTDPSMFFGRDDVFAWIVQNIGGRYSDNSLVIHGQRRVGKTSVLKQLSLRLSERYVPVFFDFQGRTHTTLDRFLWRLAREIVRTLGKQGVELERPEREPFSRDPEHFARGFLDQVRESLGERNLLLVFDEFDSLEAPTAKEMLAVDLVPYFSRMMHGAERVNFIFSIGSSGHKLEHMRAEYTDFFRPALYKKISFLDLEQGRRLIVEPVRGIMEYQPDAVDQILGMTSGHPYFTQLMCHELFALAQQTQDWTIRLDDVERILPDVIERGTVNLKFMWDYASDAERYTLAALAEMEEGGSKQDVVATLRKHKVRISEEEVGTAILNLVARDVLAGEYGFTVDLMRHWMLQNRPMERVVDELAEKHPIAVRFSQIAVEYREQGELDRALESYQSALDAAPDYIPAHLGVAEIHHERGAWPEAAAAYQRILELDDEQIQARMGLCEAMLALGDTAREAGDTAGALERYQQVLEIYAEHTEAWERLAGLYLTRAEELAGRKRWQAAGEALAQAWKYIPEEARGERQEVTGEERAAIEQELVALRQALGMMRTQLAHEQIARAGKLRDGKQFGAALTALERARTYAPELAGLEQAIEETREAEREAGLERMHAAGMRAMRAGRWRDAVSTFERLLALEPEDARVVEEIEQQLARARQQQTLAQTYTTAVRAMEEGRHRRAASLFRQLLTQEPTYRNVQQLLADTQRQRRGRWLRAAGIAVAGLIVLGALGYALSRPESPLMVALGTPTATATATPIPPTTTPTPTPIPSPTPTPTPIPLAWRRLTSSQFIRRDTVTAVVIDPSDPDVWYAGTKNAGIYKSINGGISWVPIHNGLGQAQIDTLIMDPEDPNTLYAGTSTGVYKTTDGGQSWQLANSGIDASGRGHGDIVLSPHDSQHLFYTTDGDGIYKSEDGAESWDELPLSSVIG
ncbi:MAG: tetratricopeptide repeat protein, partial [Anaerolineae bacterium]